MADALCNIVKSDSESSSYLNSSVQSLLRQTSNLIQDVNQVTRLRTQAADYLSPSNKNWIDRKLSAANDTLRAVALLLIPLHDDHQRSGGFNFRTRLKFMIDKEKVEAHSKALTSIHVAINSTMPFLENAESRKRFIEPEEVSWGDENSSKSSNSRHSSQASHVGYRRPKLRESSRISRASEYPPAVTFTRHPSNPPAVHLRSSSFDPLFDTDLFRPGTAVSALTNTSLLPEETSDAVSIVSSIQPERPEPDETQHSMTSGDVPILLDVPDAFSSQSNASTHALRRTASFESTQNLPASDSPLTGNHHAQTTVCDYPTSGPDTRDDDADMESTESPSERQERELSLHGLYSPTLAAPEPMRNPVDFPPRSSSWHPALADRDRVRSFSDSNSQRRSIPESLTPGSPIIRRKPIASKLLEPPQAIIANDGVSSMSSGSSRSREPTLREQSSNISLKRPTPRSLPNPEPAQEPV